MPGKIFINYRRDDERAVAARIRDRLAGAFGSANVFMDVDNLMAGQRFDIELAKALADTDVFLSVIGPKWMDLLDERKLAGDRDYVREEIAGALKNRITVIPVLIERTPLPRADTLPDDIRKLVLHQKHEVSHERFGRDVAELVEAIKFARKPAKGQVLPAVPWGWVGATAASVMAIGWVSAYQLGAPVWVPWSPGMQPLQPTKEQLEAAARQSVLKEQEAKRQADETKGRQTAAEVVEAKGAADAGKDKRAEPYSSAARTLESGANPSSETETSFDGTWRLAFAVNEHCRIRNFEYTWDIARGKVEGRAATGSVIGSVSRGGILVVRWRDSFLRGRTNLVRASLSGDSGKGDFSGEGDEPVTQLCAGTVTLSRVAQTSNNIDLKPGETFRDCPVVCPEMVVVPAGEFTMGSNDGAADEKPPHKVTIRQPFAVGKFEVTFAEWEACVAGGGCASNKSPKDEGWGMGHRPVINVSWNDAKEYVAWLTRKTGKTYRLMSEAEWEYAARAGTTTKYAFGDAITKSQAQFSEGSRGSAGKTVDVGSFQANKFGLHDMHGNVWEWCEDNWHSNYQGAPNDGTVWSGGDTSSRVVRGGSWSLGPDSLRSASRGRGEPFSRYGIIGFRLARIL